MTREDIKTITDIVHKTIYGFFDVCGDDEETPMTDKDKLLLKINKAICNNIKALEKEPYEIEAIKQAYSKGFEDCRQAVLAIAGDSCLDLDSYEDTREFCDEIKELSPVIAQPKMGKWIAYEVQLPDRTILNYRCSVCGRKLIGYNTETLSEAPFCHCGAKMQEVEE